MTVLAHVGAICNAGSEEVRPEPNTAGAFVRPEVVATYDELWRCRYCRCPFVVPSLARDHERTCPSREA